MNAGATVVRCHYCRRQTERRQLRTLAESTPRDFTPPKVWRPPTHVEASSDDELAYGGSGGKAWIYVVAAVAVTLAAGAAFFSGKFSPPLSKFAKVDLAGSPSEVGARLGGNASKDRLVVRVDHPQTSAMTLQWDEGESSHPNYVGFGFSKTSKLPSSVCTRLAARLGEFREGTWSLGRIHVRCDLPGNTLSGNVSPPSADEPPDGGRWKRSLAMIQRLLVATLLERDDDVSPSEVREALGTGSTLADLGKLDLDTEFDAVDAMLGEKLPGAVHSKFNGWELWSTFAPLPHVRLDWENKKGGKPSSMSFDTSGYQPLGALAPKVVGCLTKSLGKPDVREVDHAKGTVNYVFGASAVWLYPSSLSIPHPRPELLRAVLVGLQRCE